MFGFKKNILVAAVAAVASSASLASEVVMYGVVDMGYQRSSSSDTGALKNRNALDSGLQSGSRIGFRGTEDLGNGLKASFVLEYGLAADTGVFGTTARQSFLALSNSYGTVAAGRQYTPQYGLLAKVDPFGTGTVGDVVFGRGVYVVGAAAAPATIRLNNMAAYVSPTVAGFNVIAGYTANGLADESTVFSGSKSADAKIWAINPNYANGPLFVGLNYHQVEIDTLGYKDKVWDLGATYDFGAVKLAGVYGQLTNNVFDSKTKQWMLGATVPVGASGNVLVSYARNKTDIAGFADAKASKWAVGYTHALSKRTNLYAAYAKISTNTMAEGVFSVQGGDFNPIALTTGRDYTAGLNLGVRHTF